MTLGEIYDSQRESIPQLAEGAVALYQSAVEHNLEKILAAVNIESIVEEKVSSFDIIYLGALLGFLMGFCNLLL